MATKTVLVTGGNSGLGFECAKAIAAAPPNWNVVIASRDERKGAHAVAEIKAATGNEAINAMALDLGETSETLVGLGP